MRILILALFMVMPAIANGQSSCSLVRKLAENLGCDLYRTMDEDKVDDFIVRNSFAMTDCLVGEKYDSALASLDKECSDWLDQQKADLGKKYVTGTCRKTCSACGTGSKCRFDAEAHYKVE